MKLKYRVGIIIKDGTVASCNFNTKKEAEDFVLETAEKLGVKSYRIIDREIREIVTKGKDL